VWHACALLPAGIHACRRLINLRPIAAIHVHVLLLLAAIHVHACCMCFCIGARVLELKKRDVSNAACLPFQFSIYFLD
jgi:hypothetical protein